MSIVIGSEQTDNPMCCTAFLEVLLLWRDDQSCTNRVANGQIFRLTGKPIGDIMYSRFAEDGQAVGPVPLIGRGILETMS